MSREMNDTLQRAYELIEADAYDDAKALLETYIEDDPNSADAWWLMAYAADDADEANRALQRVLRIDPNYPGARELSESFAQQAAPTASPTRLSRLGERPAAAAPASTASFDDFDDDDFEDDFDDEDEDDEERVRQPMTPRRRLVLILATAAVVLTVLGLVVLATRFRDQAPAASTEVAQATPQATAEVGVEPTNEVAEGNNFQAIYDALTALNVIDGSAEVITTSRGETLAVSVCSGTSVSELRTATSDALGALASVSASAAESVRGLGIKLVNCDGDGSVQRFVTVDLASAVEFAGGTIDAAAFSTRWDAEPAN